VKNGAKPFRPQIDANGRKWFLGRGCAGRIRFRMFSAQQTSLLFRPSRDHLLKLALAPQRTSVDAAPDPVIDQQFLERFLLAIFWESSTGPRWFSGPGLPVHMSS